MRAKIFSILLIAIMPGVVLADVDVSIDLGIVCNDKTMPRNEIFIDASSASGFSGETCIEKDSYISNVKIKNIKLGYITATNTYVLFLFSDMTKKKNIQAMSKDNLMRDMVIIKNHKLIADGIIGAPLRNGVIPLALLTG